MNATETAGNRIIVLGCPGAGKSVFSEKLSRIVSIQHTVATGIGTRDQVQVDGLRILGRTLVVRHPGAVITRFLGIEDIECVVGVFDIGPLDSVMGNLPLYDTILVIGDGKPHAVRSDTIFKHLR